MDIAKFNQELSYKVAKANGLEKNKKFQEAIDLWLDISEMALNASKTPKIEVYYKSMLIEKTKQIINHVKYLKSKLYEQKGITPLKTTELKPNEEKFEEKTEITQTELSDSSIVSNETETPKEISETKIIESNDIQNLPIGFKEIETSEDFTIITPHDKDYVKKLVSQDHDISVFTHEDKEVKAHTHNEPVQSINKSKIICFACGSEVPANSKVCRTCGTNLK
jgi:ribosomal protein L40E